MNYYSTNKQAPIATLEEAVVKGLAGDKGLYMPERIVRLDPQVIEQMKEQSFHEIACTVARAFFGEDVEPETLDQIVCDTLAFETPVVEVKDPIYSLELFHGPTLAFKDVGGRFMARQGKADELVVCVPSGNFGNITAGLFAHRMGLPIKRFVAANNRNDVFLEYLQTGVYTPRPSVATLANAMDVGNPSNFARIIDLYSYEQICALISGYRYTDEQIAEAIRRCHAETGYLLDPHGACGYQALKAALRPGETGVFLETAHPAKFKGTVDQILGADIEIPAKLRAFMAGQKQSIELSKDFEGFKRFLLAQ